MRSILQTQGSILHQAAGAGGSDWLYTEAELGAIAPPLTRILNRYDATRAAAGTGDEIALVIGLSAYVGRSYQERRAALRLLEEVEDEPITGVAAEPGTGPPPAAEDGDVDWQRELP